jgi:hypothetical protein
MHLIWAAFHFLLSVRIPIQKNRLGFFVSGAESFVLDLNKRIQALGEENNLQIDMVEFFKPHFDCPSGPIFLLRIPQVSVDPKLSTYLKIFPASKEGVKSDISR